MLALLRLIVEFTPTEKDNEALLKLESVLHENPVLFAEFAKLFFKVLRAKTQ